MHKCPKSRNNYIFVHNDCIDHLKNITVGSLPCTYNNKTKLIDHRYLKCILNFYRLEKGEGYRKMNISHLKNEEDKQEVVDIFTKIDSALEPHLK